MSSAFLFKAWGLSDPRMRTMRVDSLLEWTITRDQLHHISNNKAHSVGRHSSMMSVPCFNHDDPSTAFFRNVAVHLNPLPKPLQRISFKLSQQIVMVLRTDHQNLQKVIGILVEKDYCEVIVTEFCDRGSLRDLLANDDFELDSVFRVSLIKDLLMGMMHLHQTSIKSHGRLSAPCCMIDSRFVLKIGDFGIPCLVEEEFFEVPNTHLANDEWEIYLWRAPEFLRVEMPKYGSQKGDVYSFAIIVHQILMKSMPFCLNSAADSAHGTFTAKDVVLEIQEGSLVPLRPPLRLSTTPYDVMSVLEMCWRENPIKRPTFPQIKVLLYRYLFSSHQNIGDHLTTKMERYAIGLEKKVLSKTQQFMEEKHRSDTLLMNMLPKPIAISLLVGESLVPESFDEVTVFFSDIPEFLDLVSGNGSTPLKYIDLLNNLYSVFDDVIDHCDAYKIEFLQDVMLVASGLPKRNGDRHASEIGKMALELRHAVSVLQQTSFPDHSFSLRAGIHTGGKIQCTTATKLHLTKTDDGRFTLTYRGLVNVKGRGRMDAYWLEER